MLKIRSLAIFRTQFRFISHRLENQVAIITGAASGIGRYTAYKFAKEGCKVVVADIDEQGGQETVKEIKSKGGIGIFQKADISNEQELDELVQRAVRKFNTVHILVNNASSIIFGHVKGKGKGSKYGSDRQITDEDWNTLFRINLLGAVKLTERVVPYMQKNEPIVLKYRNDQGIGEPEIDAGYRGSIINVSSTGAIKANPETLPYQTFKSALLQVTKCCALDLAPWKIRVNSVLPGYTSTPLMGNILEQHLKIKLETGLEKFQSFSKFKRLAAPQEIANSILFLASSDSSYVTGASLVVDGGITL